MRKRERRNAKSQENSVKALTGDLTEGKNVLWSTTQATSRRFINPSKTGSKDEERKERRAGGEEEEIREPGARRHCRNFGHYNNKEPS
ncbi:hypothetical protein V1478_016614 [Vespula squamosa]|uniref:Uncharacterized protein n=1 Tax=Vespula squamosa TaxID=30214 RepID=A0ABD2A0S9_VESSQ